MPERSAQEVAWRLIIAWGAQILILHEWVCMDCEALQDDDRSQHGTVPVS